jgi:hypothetical protein
LASLVLPRASLLAKHDSLSFSTLILFPSAFLF